MANQGVTEETDSELTLVENQCYIIEWISEVVNDMIVTPYFSPLKSFGWDLQSPELFRDTFGLNDANLIFPVFKISMPA